MEKNKLRATSKYDWFALKQEFFESEFMAVYKFIEFKKIPLNPNTIKKTFGWGKEKESIKEKALQKATERMIENTSVDMEEVSLRQSKLARWLQLKGAEALKDLTLMDVDDARKLIISGLKEERAALGVGKKGGATNLTQVNVNLPKTRFDEMLDGLSYEDTLKLIAEVKRIRTKIDGVEAVADSATEAQ